jgi:DNA-directed RNA polymerase specialized sigma24 family protein
LRNSDDDPADAADARLLRAHARGDPHAFADLLARYRSRILHLVRCRVGATSLWVEDIAQDVFVQVHRKAGTFDGRSSVKTWLYAVAINVCRDHQRHERRAPPAAPVPIDALEPPSCPTPRSIRWNGSSSRNATASCAMRSRRSVWRIERCSTCGTTRA